MPPLLAHSTVKLQGLLEAGDATGLTPGGRVQAPLLALPLASRVYSCALPAASGLTHEAIPIAPT